jgi:cell division protein FtsI/penicillin-binding protein 2
MLNGDSAILLSKDGQAEMAEQNPKNVRNANPQKSARAKKDSNPNPKLRLYCLAAFLLLWVGLIGYRLVVLQVVRYGEFSQRAARQQQRTVEVSPRRGVIYDRNGRALAMTVSVDSVFAVPSEIPDPATAASLLAQVLNAEPKEILAKIESSRNFTWIARKIDADQSERLRGMNLKGIYFQKEFKRFYPKGDLAAQVLGYVGLDDEGLGGVERSFDEQLRGKPGKMLVSVDAKQRSLGRVEKQPEPGQNIVLTIDENIQFIAERELQNAINQTHAQAGTVVVQDPHTGEILALASYPTFNPNAFRSSTPSALKNRAVSDVYEPGSVFKIVTLSAALEEKLTNPDEVIDCQMGAITVFGRVIHDHKPYGNLTVTQIMQNSSDVGAIKLGLRLGDQRMDHYIREYGFGAQTGVEVPGETRGIARRPERWTKSSIGSISMGQEVGVSSVQLVSMVSTIANDGIYTPPRLVAGELPPSNSNGVHLQTVAFKPAGQHRVVSPLTAVEMKKILENVVLFGTGKKAILDGYTSGGKTGTAQKIDPATGRYSARNYIASFAGFAPVNKPMVTISVMLDSPQVGGHEGGLVSAPLFARVTQQVLAYMNVPHDADVHNAQRLMIRASAKPSDFEEGSPDRFSSDGTDTMAELQSGADVMKLPVSASPRNESEHARLLAASFTPQVAQKPKTLPPIAVPREAPHTGPVPPANGTVILAEGSQAVAPKLLGKTVRAALEAAQDAGVEIDVVGSGVAKAQIPAPGERIAPGAHVMVTFQR